MVDVCGEGTTDTEFRGGQNVEEHRKGIGTNQQRGRDEERPSPRARLWGKHLPCGQPEDQPLQGWVCVRWLVNFESHSKVLVVANALWRIAGRAAPNSRRRMI